MMSNTKSDQIHFHSYMTWHKNHVCLTISKLLRLREKVDIQSVFHFTLEILSDTFFTLTNNLQITSYTCDVHINAQKLPLCVLVPCIVLH